MFDLRSDTEIAKYDAATPQIAGVTVFRAPVFAKEDYSPERELLSQFISVWALVDAFNSGAFVQLYSEILDAGGPAFGAILCHVRDSQMMASSSIALLGKTGLDSKLLCIFSLAPRIPQPHFIRGFINGL